MHAAETGALARTRLHEPALHRPEVMPANIGLCSVVPSRATCNARFANGRCTPCSYVYRGGAITANALPPDNVDVLVIGSGVGGLCAASLLARYAPGESPACSLSALGSSMYRDWPPYSLAIPYFLAGTYLLRRMVVPGNNQGFLRGS